jgi:hypothetical protein
MTRTAAFHLARQAVKLTGDIYYVVEGRRHRDWTVTHVKPAWTVLVYAFRPYQGPALRKY